MRRGLSAFNLTSLALGLAFLYLPIAILVVYSFNASRLVTVWGGWSTRWYAALIEDRAMTDAALASLGIAIVSAALATVLGTMAAMALTRFRFRGRLPFAAMIYAPLVMPAVIAGFLLAFSLSLDDLVIASFTTGPGATTLPIRIYSEVRLGVKPEINAVCTIMIAVVAVAVVAASWLTRRARDLEEV